MQPLIQLFGILLLITSLSGCAGESGKELPRHVPTGEVPPEVKGTPEDALVKQPRR